MEWDGVNQRMDGWTDGWMPTCCSSSLPFRLLCPGKRMVDQGGQRVNHDQVGVTGKAVGCGATEECDQVHQRWAVEVA
jgi:hypothetical protein